MKRETLIAALPLLLAMALALTSRPAQAQEGPAPLSWRASLPGGVKASGAGGVTGVRLDFLGQSALRLSGREGEPQQQGWLLSHIRPGANVDLEAPDGSPLHLFFQAEFAGASPQLLDAQAEWRPSREFGLLVGRYRPLFSRGWTTGLMALAMPGRGAVQDAFHPGRAVGVTARGELDGGTWEYALGALDAGPLDASQERLPLATARLVWNPLGPTPYTQTPWFEGIDGMRLAVGLNGHASQAGPLEESGRRQATGSADVTFFWPRLAWLSEAFARRQGDQDTWGAYSQLSYLLSPRTLDVALRAGQLEDRQSLETSLSWYLEGNHAKLMLHGQLDQWSPQGASSYTEYQANLFAQIWL